MESLNFPVAAFFAAATRFAWIGSFAANSQERKAVRGFSCVIVLATLAGALVFSGTVSAETTLTLAEAQRRAVERSRQISAHNAAVVSSREMAVAAGRLPDPMLQLGIDNLPIEGPDQFSVARDFMTMRRIGVMQEFTRSEKRQLRAQRFEREAEKSLAVKTATIASTQRDTALAWLDRYYAETMASVIAQQAKEVKLEILAVEGAYRGGRGNQADVFAAHSALVGLEDQASEIDRRIRTAKSDLARWVGDGADAPLAGKPAIDSIRLDIGALDTQLAHHPEITVLAKQEEIASTEARIAQADKKADWSVEVMYSQRGPSYSNMVSVGVSIPLQWDQKNRQNRELASKLAMAEQARAEREEALRAHIGEVRAMVAEWENGRERVARYERELIPLAKERTKAALAAYQGGKANLTDLLLARRDEIDLRMQAVQLEMDIARLWAQLNFLFPDGIGTTTASVPVQPTVIQTKELK
ncbi:MAG TPA: TolC family protein [Burkholderiales bacterium]|jgi:outer membrane protein TolC|nr:TolC family protein [Burkholderiales bacterium]